MTHRYGFEIVFSRIDRVDAPLGDLWRKVFEKTNNERTITFLRQRTKFLYTITPSYCIEFLDVFVCNEHGLPFCKSVRWKAGSDLVFSIRTFCWNIRTSSNHNENGNEHFSSLEKYCSYTRKISVFFSIIGKKRSRRMKYSEKRQMSYRFATYGPSCINVKKNFLCPQGHSFYLNNSSVTFRWMFLFLYSKCLLHTSFILRLTTFRMRILQNGEYCTIYFNYYNINRIC